MNNIEKLFEYNTDANYKIRVKNKRIYFESKAQLFSGGTINLIINFINTLHKKYGRIKLPIIFKFGELILADKITYVIFDCICYYLIKYCGNEVYLYWRPKNDIYTQGVYSSPLLLLNTKINNYDNMKGYVNKFRFDLYQQHYRFITEDMEDNYLGAVYQRIDSFLKIFDISEEYRDDISELISELVGNACEHTGTECLVDIDVTTNHTKTIESVEQDGNYYGINIAIINFSDKLLGDGIKEKLALKKILELRDPDIRYTDLVRAYTYHKTRFSDEYKEMDFYNIAAIQDKISGRLNQIFAGGTGLTKLIRNLQDKADTDQCYVLSGDRCLNFIKDILNYDDGEWLGFNETSDFFQDIPRDGVVTDCPIFFPGTAYNLHFIMKREDSL